MSLAERQLSSVLAFLTALNNADLAGIEAPLSTSPSFSHTYLPSTLGAAASAPRTRAEMMTIMKHTFENVVHRMGVELPPKELVQDEKRQKIVVLVRDQGVARGGSAESAKKGGQGTGRAEGWKDEERYDIEYVIVFGFEEGTDRILMITEYQDSAYVNRKFEGWYKED